jgi:hypothetical protein
MTKRYVAVMTTGAGAILVGGIVWVLSHQTAPTTVATSGRGAEADPGPEAGGQERSPCRSTSTRRLPHPEGSHRLSASDSK